MKPYTPTYKPIQLIKKVWGLRGSEKNCGLTLIHNDTTLMDMDAPEAIPAGSMRRYQPLPDSDPEYFTTRETVVLRGELNRWNKS